MLAGTIFCMLFLFYHFCRCLFFLLFDRTDFNFLCHMDYRKIVSFLLSLSVVPCCLKLNCFLLFSWDSYLSYYLIPIISFMLLSVFPDMQLLAQDLYVIIATVYRWWAEDPNFGLLAHLSWISLISIFEILKVSNV